MPRKRNETLVEIFAGPVLRKIISGLGIEEGEGEKFLVIYLTGTTVKVGNTEGMSRQEILGSLYMACDRIALEGRE